MTQTILPPVKPADPPVEEQIKELAVRLKAAKGPGVQLLSALGATADGLLDRLPSKVKDGLNATTIKALDFSFDAASKSRSGLPDTGPWLTRAITTGTGAAGGFGGTTTALAELPVTTTVLLRAIQGIAVEHGFDPEHPDTRLDCLQVFAAAGPLAEDDQIDVGFLTLRLSVSGSSVQAMLKQVAPKFAFVLGQKLAAQTVPILGAITGAAINYSFTSYYQDIAHVQFGLRRLSEDTGQDRAALIEALKSELTKP